MREVAFIEQNKKKWIEFEQVLYKNKSASANYLSNVYTQLNNDLSYAQTFYPKSKLVIYLNALAINAFHRVYKTERSFDSFFDFWKKTVPEIAYKYRHYIWSTFILFSIFVFIGVISSMYDDTFIRSILGDEYVDQTLKNIENGDPAAIYNNSSVYGDVGSFLGITINNVRVGLLMYISGLTLGIGTFKLLLSNSIMLGAFQTMFFLNGKLLESMSAIWIHGAMEIFGMVIEASAGFILGLAWLFPGKDSRKNKFIESAKDSLILVLGTVPFTISAGLLEGFITQYYNEIPAIASTLIILSTLFLIGYYFLILPFKHKPKSKISIEDYV